MNDVIDFSKGDTTDPGEGAELVRQQGCPSAGPADLELTVDVGLIRVELHDAGDEVRVEVRHDPTAGGSWGQGIAGIMSWLDNAAGGARVMGDPAQLAADAVRTAEISWSEPGRRLVVRSSQELPARLVPLAVTVAAPAGSRITARTGAGDVTVTGQAGRTTVRTGSGTVTVAAVDGDAEITTGSGDVDLGAVTGRARVRTGSGAIAVAATGGVTEVRTGSGDITLGAVSADLGVRTGSGEVSISDARAGQLDLTTNSGELRIAVHPGVAAELDLSSGSGKARSELAVAGQPPEQGSTLRVRGRTGSGDVLVTRATVPA